MSGNGVGETVRTWWLMSLRPEHHPKIGEDTSAARALRARLRRPSAPTEVLAERAVHDLVRRVPALRRHAARGPARSARSRGWRPAASDWSTPARPSRS